MVRLHDQVRRIPVGAQAGFLDGGCECLVGGEVFPAEVELGLAGAPLRHNGDRLKPDDRAAPFRLLHIAAEGVFRRGAVILRVGALHRGDTQAVGHRHRAEGHRLGQYPRIRREGQLHPQRLRPGFELVEILVMEPFMRHNDHPFRLLKIWYTIKNTLSCAWPAGAPLLRKGMAPAAGPCGPALPRLRAVSGGFSHAVQRPPALCLPL